jgi:hypothetical protein
MFNEIQLRKREKGKSQRHGRVSLHKGILLHNLFDF